MSSEETELDEHCPDCGRVREPYHTIARDEPSPDERVKFTCGACNTIWEPKWGNVSDDYEWPRY